MKRVGFFSFIKICCSSFMMGCVLVAGHNAQAEIIHFSGHFLVAKGIKPSTVTGRPVVPSGLITADWDTVTHRLSYTLSYLGLSGPVTEAHFHGPATAQQTAGPLLSIAPPFQTGMHRAITVDRRFEEALHADKIYINLHTLSYPHGEARAQLIESKQSVLDYE